MKTNAKDDSKSNFSIKNSISYSSFNLFTRYQSSHASFLYILIQYCPEFHHSLLVILIIKILYISFEIVTFKLLLTTFKKYIYIYVHIWEGESISGRTLNRNVPPGHVQLWLVWISVSGAIKRNLHIKKVFPFRKRCSSISV